MPRRRIVIEGDDDVIINLGQRRKTSIKPSDGQSPVLPTSRLSEPDDGDFGRSGKDSLIITARIKNLIELRAESSFRVNQPDFEIIYALSGPDYCAPDTFHHFASQRVVEDARPDTVTPTVTGIIELIQKERELGDNPRLIVINHTHPAPGNIPQPSTNDERFFKSAAQILLDSFPNARILFGVHAISGEAVRRREPPTKSAPHRISWASVIREHELAFFAPDGTPFQVEYDG